MLGYVKVSSEDDEVRILGVGHCKDSVVVRPQGSLDLDLGSRPWIRIL